jgi:squalene-hopene/tetraprenyl-beta-curcumene cyclase
MPTTSSQPASSVQRRHHWTGTILCSLCCLLFQTVRLAADEPAAKPQYEADGINVPQATADEPKRPEISVRLAAEYLEHGTIAWNQKRSCVTCHTNGIYMTVRPALTPYLGRPRDDAREFFVKVLKDKAATEREKLLRSTLPAQVIYTAAGLAEWDAHVTKQLSPETDQALRLMFDIQLESGTWGTLDCWPPYESDAYHEATVAAMAAATAPGWLANLKDEKVLAAVDRLKKYLRTQSPPHDYGRTLLLWASTRVPDLIDSKQKSELIEMLAKHQRPDGGWSIRTFAAPEAWGNGGRAKKLQAEPEFTDPPSDGHQTGLAIVVLRAAGVDAKDERVQRGVKWLLANQRASGRWWTRSLNTDTYHFITYSGTAFPLMALAACDAIPEPTAGGCR